MKENQDSLGPQGGGDESREPESSAARRKDPRKEAVSQQEVGGASLQVKLRKDREAAIGRYPTPSLFLSLFRKQIGMLKRQANQN